MENTNYRGKIEEIKGRYLHGIINHAQAKSEVETLLVDMNAKGAEVAKKYGKKFNKLTFAYVMR